MKIFALVGETSVGKSTVERLLVSRLGLNRVVSYTTRPKRPSESLDDYHFVSDDVFDDRVSRGLCLEKTEYMVNGKRFRYSFGIDSFSHDLVNVMVVNPHGLSQIIPKLTKDDEIVIILIKASLKTKVERYLSREDLKDQSVYKRLVTRLVQDDEDFRQFENEDIKKYLDSKKTPNTNISFKLFENENEECLNEIVKTIEKSLD